MFSKEFCNIVDTIKLYDEKVNVVKVIDNLKLIQYYLGQSDLEYIFIN